MNMKEREESWVKKVNVLVEETFNFFFFPASFFTHSLWAYFICYGEISTQQQHGRVFDKYFLFLQFRIFLRFSLSSTSERKKWKSFDVKLSPLITHYLLVCDSIFLYEAFLLSWLAFRSMHCRREWCVIETAFVWHWSGKLSFSSLSSQSTTTASQVLKLM